MFRKLKRPGPIRRMCHLTKAEEEKIFNKFLIEKHKKYVVSCIENDPAFAEHHFHMSQERLLGDNGLLEIITDNMVFCLDDYREQALLDYLTDGGPFY